MQVRGSSLLIYDEPIRDFAHGKSLKRQLNMGAQKKLAYSGGVSQSARKRLAKAVTIMSQAIKPKWLYNPVSMKYQRHTFSFITLTVASQVNITAREAYDKLLSHFLDWMTRTIAKVEPSAKTYIWKAELQKRGQIHYHITTPAFIHYREIQTKWNQLQREAGLLDEYAKQFGDFNPPSTDVHATYNVRRADRYLLKELGKTISALQVEAIAKIKEQLKRGELTEQEADMQIRFIKESKSEATKRVTALMRSGELTEEEGKAALKEINETKAVAVTDGKIWGCSENLAGKAYYTIAYTSSHAQMLSQWAQQGLVTEMVEPYFALYTFKIEADADPPDLLSPLEKSNFNTYCQTILN